MSSASIAHRLAMILVGLILGNVSAAIVSWVWPGMGLLAFITFVVSWATQMTNTIVLQARHPELVLPAHWVWVKIRYKPLELEKGEYEVTLTEFIRGQIALIILGVPGSLLLAGVSGLLWSSGRWQTFAVVFGLWTVIMGMGILSAINK
jgi:hypothetical protein